MGDVKTHFSITHFVTDQCKLADVAGNVPDDDWVYLELGNYLTDVSQFRDPPAHQTGREKARDKVFAGARDILVPAGAGIFGGLSLLGAGLGFGLDEDVSAGEAVGWTTLTTVAGAGLGVGLGFAVAAGIAHGDWAEAIWGGPGRRHGHLAEFFRLVNLGMAHQLFTPEGRQASTRLAAHQAGNPIPDGAPVPVVGPTIPPARLVEVFARQFTQYWPHEHLDFPYVADAANHADDPRFVPGSRGIMQYLELHLLSLAQQLSFLEQEWVTAVAAGTPDRSDHVARLGHLLHAVEDYWFHSNFVELHRWQRAVAADANRPGGPSDPSVSADLIRLLNDALRDAGGPEDDRHRRLLRRRLRYPVYTAASMASLSTTTSEDGTTRVFTGGFGETDIWHTLGKALEGMAHNAMLGPSIQALASSELVLFELMFDQDKRRRMVCDESMDAMYERHEAQLKARAYHAAIDRLKQRGFLCNDAHAALTAAFDEDCRSEDASGFVPGAGGFLITLLDLMERERIDSLVAQEGGAAHPCRPTSGGGLDAVHASAVIDVSSANGASGENIGTHSLLAKDAETSTPFRHDAVLLAKYASAAVARRMVQRLAEDPDPTKGVDWLLLLQHYLPFPQAGTGWWNEIVHGPVDENTPDPHVPDIDTDTPPPATPLIAGNDDRVLRLRPPVRTRTSPGGVDVADDANPVDPDQRATVLLPELEDYYRTFER